MLLFHLPGSSQSRSQYAHQAQWGCHKQNVSLFSTLFCIKLMSCEWPTPSKTEFPRLQGWNFSAFSQPYGCNSDPQRYRDYYQPCTEQVNNCIVHIHTVNATSVLHWSSVANWKDLSTLITLITLPTWSAFSRVNISPCLKPNIKVLHNTVIKNHVGQTRVCYLGQTVYVKCSCPNI